MSDSLHEYSLIDADIVRDLSVMKPWRSLATLVFDYAIMLGAVVVSESVNNIFVYLLSAAIIAGRMHGLGLLMHDAAHYRIVRSHRLNDWIADLFMAWPILATVTSYRRSHLAHHQHANTLEDPDWVAKLDVPAFGFPQTASKVIRHLVGYLIVIQTVRDILRVLKVMSQGPAPKRSEIFFRLAYYLSIIGVCAWFGLLYEFLLYWVIPYFTFFGLFLHVRSVAEHFGSMNYEIELGSTRTVKPFLWERMFFAPHQGHYHLDHHLFPSVPFYNVPKLHEALMGSKEFRQDAHITRGYVTGLVRECLA